MIQIIFKSWCQSILRWTSKVVLLKRKGAVGMGVLFPCVCFMSLPSALVPFWFCWLSITQIALLVMPIQTTIASDCKLHLGHTGLWAGFAEGAARLWLAHFLCPVGFLPSLISCVFVTYPNAEDKALFFSTLIFHCMAVLKTNDYWWQWQEKVCVELARWLIHVNLTQARVILEERISVKKIPPPKRSVGKPVGCFLD